MSCEKCGTEMVTAIKGSCLVVTCPNCGWSLVTTYIEEIRTDSTIYAITIFPAPDPTTAQIRLIAKLANVNWLQANDLLGQKEVLLVQEKAPKIKQITQALDKVNIAYRIFPENTL